MLMTCKIGNVEMVKIVFFRAIYIYLGSSWVGLSNHWPKPNPNLNQVDKTKPKQCPKPTQTSSWVELTHLSCSPTNDFVFRLVGTWNLSSILV